jgi:hypothetical protein
MICNRASVPVLARTPQPGYLKRAVWNAGAGIPILLMRRLLYHTVKKYRTGSA